MFADLKPYPEYRSTRLDWLPRIPSGWDTRRLRFSLKELDRRSDTGSEQLLRVSQYTGVTERRVADGADPDTRARSLVGYKLVEPGELVVNIMLAWNGSLGVSPHSGIVSPAYCVYRFADTMQPDYYHHLLRSPIYKSRIKMESTGVVESRLRLYSDDLKRLDGLVPPEAEQAAIVRYLAHANRRIDQAISAKRKLVRLLEEQKRVIINQAVTRGLDASVPLKDSQIPWVGQVPAHWTVTRLKAVMKSLDSKRVPLSSLERGTMTAREFDYYGASGVIDKVDGYLFDSPSVLLAEDGANLVLRNLPLAIIARGKYWVNNHAHVLRPIDGSLEFLAHALERIDYRPWITGAAQPKLTQDRLMAVQIALPAAAEQHEIAARLADETSESDAVIRRARLEIDLLREFRTRLTADVVTGQVDVRDVAASLPDMSLEELAEAVEGPVDDELDELAEEFVEDAALV